MKNGRASVFSVFVMVIYFAAICFVSVFAVVESKSCNIVAASEFTALSNAVLQAGKTPAKAGASQFDAAKSFIDSSKLIEAVIVERNGAICLAYPPSSRCIQKNSQDRTVIRPIPPIQKPFSRRISIQRQDDTKVIASMRIVRKEKIFPVLKFCLAIIVAATILMIFIGFSCDDDENADKNNSSFKKEAKFFESAENSIGIRAKEPGIKVEINNNSHNSAPYSSAGEFPSESGSAKLSADIPASGATGSFEQIEPQKQIESDAAKFSRQTGLGWKSRLESRLEEELSLAAKTEQDLSVATICCEGLPRSSVAAQKIGRLLLERMGDPNVVFEKDSDSFFAIFRDTVVDKAISVCEDIFSDIEKTLRDESVEAKTSIGLSSRAHRLVPAGRLIREAEAAQGKATEESQYPIVAFRANDRKYRQYVDESYRARTI